MKLTGDGFAVVSNVLDETATDALRAALENTAGVRRGGVRNLLERKEIWMLAASDAVRRLVKPILGADAFAVRGILFDKTPDANWLVPWHQDLTIAVRDRRDVRGFGAWSQKAGVPHVQPPVAVLETMLTIRLHLDDCGVDNGPLRVLPGSHQSGRLTAAQIADCRAQIAEVVCPVPLGGALLMRPLLLHASSPALLPARRRVVHLEFAANALPGGLEWQRA